MVYMKKLDLKKKLKIWLGRHGYLYCGICGGKQVQLSRATVKSYGKDENGNEQYGSTYEFTVENRECNHEVDK